jgi:hypothetical protein
MCSQWARLAKYLDASQNLVDLEKGPLREFVHCPADQYSVSIHMRIADDVLAALDEAWAPVKGSSSSYFH